MSQSTTEGLIEARNLTKVFKDFWGRTKVKAVEDLTLDVWRGEVFGLLGPNGSGKSTTIKLFLGLLYPTSGELSIFGRPPTDARVKSRIGYMPEESYLYRFLTPIETLDFYGRLFDLGASECRERANQLVEMVGLGHARHRVVGEFSKGMARRLVLAQALINTPDLVLLDEPTSGLDPIACRQFKDLILSLADRGTTVVLCSHLLADVEDVCDRIAILYDGRLCAAGKVADLLREPSHVRLTLPAPAPATLEELLWVIRQAVGEEPAVDHPAKPLEQFFIEAVGRASGASEEATPRGRTAEHLGK